MAFCKKPACRAQHAQMMTDAECGHETTRAGMKLCHGCSTSQGACESCGEALAPAKLKKPPRRRKKKS